MYGVFEDEIDCKRILREINLLKKLKHPFVIQIIDIIEPKNLENFDYVKNVYISLIDNFSPVFKIF